jgi:hypothetical protein
MSQPDWFETFEQSFRDNLSGCRASCVCGREFYNPGGGWDWSEGELEALAAQKATASEYAIGYVTFEGKTYVDHCDCWHERAKRIGNFVLDHREKIAEFLNKDRERLLKRAERMAEVEP